MLMSVYGVVVKMELASTSASSPLRPKHYRIEINKMNWEVPERYQDLSPVGIGAFGAVCSALDIESGTRVALKKLARPFQSAIHGKRCYRELRLLKHLNHDNIIGLKDVFTPSVGYDDFYDVYLVTELMGSDLHKIVRTQALTDEHVKFFIYQIMRGLKYVHSAGIIHRDLKPSNVGVSEDCEIKILDFGLARATAEIMTGYVTTRYWRAPEIMLNWMHYTQKVDIWSVGCIMAELLTGQILFPGCDYKDHLTRILQICGTPDSEFMIKIEADSAQTYLASLPPYPRKDFHKFFLGANPSAIDLLNQLLAMDPDRRPTAEEALKHPYLTKYHFPDDEPECDRKYDDSFEALELTTEEWRKLVYDEITTFTPSQRQESMETELPLPT